MGIGSNAGGAEWPGKDPEADVLINVSPVGHDFVETLGIELADGRSFSRDFPSDLAVDTTGGWLINEETAKLMGKESVVGTEFYFQNIRGPIVGVMKNFNFTSLRRGIEPLALYLNPDRTRFIMLRVDANDITETIQTIEAKWSGIVPSYPFEYEFLDAQFDQMYRAEARMSQLLAWFAIIAIAIACLGLVGLAAFTAQQRRREIGIRKVLGASHQAISMLMCKEFLVLVLIANALAWPFAYFASQSWLDGFAYKADIGFAIFVATGIGAVLIALTTVSWQAIRAALVDPVEALRAE